MRNDHEQVRERAYLLWEQAGRPENRSLEFWLAAMRELDNETPSQHVVEEGVLDAEPADLAFRSLKKTATD